MSIAFTNDDVLHNIAVKFIQANLPGAKKPYNLMICHQKELGIKEIAAMADIYNVGSDPKTIEEGLTTGLELISYLIADGYSIKTPFFNMKLCIRGEYNGTETRLPKGVLPEARFQPSAGLRNYLKKRVKVEFVGFYKGNGHIAEANDGATNLVNVAAIGNILTILGYGLKIESDNKNREDVGVYFIPKDGPGIKASLIALNEPRTLKVQVPSTLIAGEEYYLRVVTMSSARNPAYLLSEQRVMQSAFTVTVHNLSELA